MSRQNPFIVIEALDAGGSQTQTDLLARRLKQEKKNVLQLHFPHEDRATGRMIYDKLLLSKRMGDLSRREQAIFYIQDFYTRAEDISEHLAAAKKNVVVSDRFYTSTLAYQTIGLSGQARQKMMTWLKWLTEEQQPKLLKPDMVLFIDTPVEVSLARLKSKKKDYFETRQKLDQIRRSYLRVAEEEAWYVFSALTNDGKEKTRPQQHRELWAVVEQYLR